jgi:hypothetical protein
MTVKLRVIDRNDGKEWSEEDQAHHRSRRRSLLQI